MKLALGMEVGLSTGDFVLDGDPVLPPQQRGSPLPIFGPFLLCPKRLDASRCHWVWRMEVGLSPGEFVLDGDPARLPKRGGAPSGFRLRISKLDRK